MERSIGRSSVDGSVIQALKTKKDERVSPVDPTRRDVIRAKFKHVREIDDIIEAVSTSMQYKPFPRRLLNPVSQSTTSLPRLRGTGVPGDKQPNHASYADLRLSLQKRVANKTENRRNIDH